MHLYIYIYVHELSAVSVVYIYIYISHVSHLATAAATKQRAIKTTRIHPLHHHPTTTTKTKDEVCKSHVPDARLGPDPGLFLVVHQLLQFGSHSAHFRVVHVHVHLPRHHDGLGDLPPVALVARD